MRFNKYGQLLLTEKQKQSSNFVAVGLALFAIGIVLYFGLPDEKFLPVAVFGAAMMLPCSVMFSPTKYKNSLLIYTIVMAFVGIAAITLTFLTGEVFNMMSVIFLFGFIAFQWTANFLLIRQSNR